MYFLMKKKSRKFNNSKIKKQDACINHMYDKRGRCVNCGDKIFVHGFLFS